MNKACSRRGIKPAGRALLVRIGAGTLQLLREGREAASYAVSTSRKPSSNVKGSLGTPTGLHEIVDRVGGEQPVGMVFKARVPTGRHFSEVSDDGNLITSRILWLGGLEDGVNRGGEVDTRQRYIYIHGTNREERIGEPLSAGCVLMRNRDIVELYEQVRAGDPVLILP